LIGSIFIVAGLIGVMHLMRDDVSRSDRSAPHCCWPA
jgi:hypothetical protein